MFKIKYIRFIFLIILFTFITLKSALSQYKLFGIQIDGNYSHKKEKVQYTPLSGQKPPPSKLLLDNNGYSSKIGIVLFFNKYLSFLIQYRSPRNCEYSYNIFENNALAPRNTFFVKTYASSYNASFRIHFKRFFIFRPFIGFGIEHLKLGGYYCTAYKDINTGEITKYRQPYTHKEVRGSPESAYFYIGEKKLLGYFIPLGISIEISNNFLFFFGGNYTFIELEGWQGDMKDRRWTITSDLIDTQDLSSRYVNFGIMVMF